MCGAASGCRSPRRRACAWRRDAWVLGASPTARRPRSPPPPAGGRRPRGGARSRRRGRRAWRPRAATPRSGGSRAGGPRRSPGGSARDPAALQPVRAEVARLDTGDERRRSRREQDLATVLGGRDPRGADHIESRVPSSPSCGTPAGPCAPGRASRRASRGRGCGPARSGPRRVPARPPRRRRTARRRWRRPRRRCSRRSSRSRRRTSARSAGYTYRLDELRRPLVGEEERDRARGERVHAAESRGVVGIVARILVPPPGGSPP